MGSTSEAVDIQQYVPLMHLTKAKSKQAVNQLFEEVFQTRNQKIITEDQRKKVIAELGIKPEEAQQLVLSIRFIIQHLLFYNNQNSQSLFPANFHANLKDLIIQIVAAHAKQWKDSLTAGQISLPRLQSFDWRVDVKTASEQISRMAVPTVLVELQVQEGASGRKVQFELTQEALQAMLDGLGKIRDQLNAVNNASKQ